MYFSFVLQVILCFGYNIYRRLYIPYNIIALMVEVNSIFLHARKLLQMQKWPFNHWLYILVVGVNLVTFVTYRLYAVLYILFDLPVMWKDLTVTYQVYMSATMFVLTIINFVLLWRLFKNDILRQFSNPKVKLQQNGKPS